MSGNLVITGGVILIALGTWLTIYGARLNSRRDSADVEHRIDDAVSRMDKLAKSAPANSQAAAEMHEVQDEFASWAETFKKESSKKKLEFEKTQLDQKEIEMNVSDRWRPYIAKTVALTRRAVDACNARVDTKIKMDEKPIPENICQSFSEDVTSVVFSPTRIWELKFFVDQPSTTTTKPSIYISFFERAGMLSTSDVIISFDRDPNSFEIYSRGPRVPRPVKIPTTSLTEFDAVVGKLIRDLVEAQILGL